MPSISIITATYNAASTLRHSLASVQEQSGLIEHVLIDGGSKDGTLAIVEDYVKSVARGSRHVAGECESHWTGQSPTPSSQPPVPCFISEPDRGIYDAMNKGIRLATGEIIGILNADDFYAGPEVLAKVTQVFEDPEVDACYGDLVYVREMLNCASRVELAPAAPLNRLKGPSVQQFNHSTIQPGFRILRYWKSGSFHPDKFRWGWMPPHPTFFVRRRVYEKYGLFNLELGSAADYELMLRLLFRHRIKVAYIPEILVCMRAGGVSNASVANRLQANKMDRKAWAVNGLRPYPWTLAMKPIRKIPQWLRKPPKV